MSAASLTAEFATPASLLAQEPHLAHAGLFLPLPTPEPEGGTACTLYITCSFAPQLAVEGQVVQVFAGQGFAFAPADGGASLKALFDAARAVDDPGEVQPAAVAWQLPVEIETEDVGDDDPRGTLYERVKAMSAREKLNLARKGSRAERLLLIKDPNKTVHTFLVQNPRITLDEVRAIAGNRQANPEALKMIADNRIWMQSSGIVTALVRNPKTPSSISTRLLDRLPKAEVARIARNASAPRLVVEAARRKVMTSGKR